MKKFSSNARITELDALSNAVIRIYQANKEVAHDAFLKSVMDEIVGISANLTSAIGQDRILSGLEDADTARDLAVKKLGTALAGYAVLPIEAKKGAAEKLLAIFNKYGKQIAKANYASESSLIESMLEDFGILEIAKTGTIAIERGRSTIYDNNKLQEEYNYGKHVL